MNNIVVPDIKEDYFNVEKAFKELKKSFGKTCFLGGTINSKNNLTYHHLFKDVYGNYSKQTPYFSKYNPLYNYINGALLCNLEHSIFNLIECSNFKLSNEFNDGFIEYKNTRMYPLIKQMRKEAYEWLYKNEYEVIEGKKLYLVRRIK